MFPNIPKAPFDPLKGRVPALYVVHTGWCLQELNSLPGWVGDTPYLLCLKVKIRGRELHYLTRKL